MSRDFRLYIVDVIQSCDRIVEYVNGYTFESFSEDYMVSDVARFRDVIAHQYFRVKLTVVWDTIQNELDDIRSAASKLLHSFSALSDD